MATQKSKSSNTKTEKSGQGPGQPRKDGKPKRKAGVDYDVVSDKVLFGTYMKVQKNNARATFTDVAAALKDEHGVTVPADIIANRVRAAQAAYRTYKRERDDGYTDKEGVWHEPNPAAKPRGLPLPPLGGVTGSRGRARDTEGLAAELGLSLD